MSHTLLLYRLQQVDSRSDHAEARLRDIDQILSNHEALRAAVEGFRASSAALQQAEHELRSCEQAVEAQRIKIEQAESSLYGGRVQNPKELQELQQDVAALKRHLVTLEDRQLEAMLALDSAQGQHTLAAARKEAVEAEALSQNRHLTDERDALLKERERCQLERAAITDGIDPAVAQLYDQLRQQRRGVAVTTLSDNACDSCGSSLTPGMQQLAKSGSQLVRCPACGRILYSA